jgi:hypothetical protein
LLKWFSMPEWMTAKFGVLQLPGNIQQGQLMLVSSKDQFLLALWKAFGRVGLRVNVTSSCGWLPITNVVWLGLEHPLSPCWPLCSQEGETIIHLLVACVLSWQFWYELRWWSSAMNREGPKYDLKGKISTSLETLLVLWSLATSVLTKLHHCWASTKDGASEPLPSSRRVFLWWLVVWNQWRG